MKTRPACFYVLALIAVAALMAGCTTTSSSRPPHQFEPIPVAKVRPQQERPPVSSTPVNELLRQAQKEFEAANTAQEKNDKDAALEHYGKMLELLGQANLDPAIFYNLRSEFERILNTSEKHARLHTVPPAAGNLRPIEPEQRIFGEIEIEFPVSERVLAELEEIQNLYPKQFQAGLDRAQKYLPYIKAEFAKAGLPEDLVWLAMVESQFSPRIVSRAGAGGMWQFMRSTGRRYGLRMDYYVDERFNWQKSTQAAALYLKELYTQFDQNWPLAVSAYNMGENGLQRAIASTGGITDLWTLLDTPPACNQIQQETKKFYAKLIASIMVAKSPEKFGFQIKPQPPEDTARVPISGSYSLRALDQVCGFPEGTLQSLNQDLLRGVTPPDGHHLLAVPKNYESVVLASLPKVQQVRPEPIRATDSRSRYHTVRRGDTISSIARKYDVSSDELMKANNIKTARYLMPGRKLYLPGTAAESEPEPAREKSGAASETTSKSEDKPEKSPKSITYTVKKGDTLSGIAQKHNVSIKNILLWNKKKDPVLYEGDKLTLKTIETIEEQEKAEAVRELYHVVQPGDCCEAIAKQYGVKLEDLLAWNDLKKDSTISVGKKLMVRGVAGHEQETTDEPPPPAKQTAITHTVAEGETLSEIAGKYKVSTKDLLAWNNLQSASVLHIGDKLVVNASKTESKPAPQTASSAKTTAPQTEPAGKKTVHTVVRGDCPSSIASKYRVKISDLYKWNDWTKSTVLQIGQKVTVYVP